MKKTILFAFLMVIFIGCNGNKNKKSDYSKKSVTTNKADVKTHPGKKLLETKCFLCHNVSTPHDQRIAPPMIAVKAHYIKEGTSKQQFIKEFVNFVQNPTKEKTKMRGAVRKFGVMPYQQFNEAEVTQIAEYLYDYQIEEPTWFKEHWQERKGKSYINTGKKISEVKQEKTTTEKGLSYALGTKKVLGKNLMGTIQKKGTLEALEFCNEKAYPLTDSMAVKFNAKIKRVSDKPRNAKNTANEKELAIINQYKATVKAKGKIKSIVEEENGYTQFYHPIVTNSMCLQCHGKPKEQIQPSVLSKLTELYPNDKAKGYTTNEVRGIWSITFKN